MELRLRGRSALIAGASKGIGKAIARGLAEECVNVVLLARTAAPLAAAAAAQAAGAFGAIHILINNAGGPIKRPERQITWPCD